MACAPSKNRHRATNALVRAFGEENGDGGGWAQLEVHALHSPKTAPTPKVERHPGHMGVAGHGVMVGFTQFHHLVVVGGAEGMERLGQGSGRRRRGARQILAFYTRMTLGYRLLSETSGIYVYCRRVQYWSRRVVAATKGHKCSY